MLAAAKLRLPRVNFELMDLNKWKPQCRYDVIFANAILQWMPDHEVLFPRLMSLLAPGGCLAAQMPDNLQEPAHALMRMIAAEGPWRAKLMPIAKSRTRIGPIEEYYGLLASSSRSIELWHTTYVHALENASKVVEWMMGSGLRPFLAPLNQDERQQFLKEYEAQILTAYPPQIDGHVLLHFPRLFIVVRLM
jgi:trans-aconitate 2-methyltransferase